MSRTIRTNISDARKDELEIKFAKESRVRIGYTRLQVLSTTHKHGRDVANQYIKWYSNYKFAIMPELEHVRQTEVTDTSKVRDIGWKYKHLRPKTTLSEPEVEDESPMSNTTGMESDSEEERSEKKSPPDEEKSTPTAKNSDAHLSEDNGSKLPSRREDPEDDSAAGSTRPPITDRRNEGEHDRHHERNARNYLWNEHFYTEHPRNARTLDP